MGDPHSFQIKKIDASNKKQRKFQVRLQILKCREQCEVGRYHPMQVAVGEVAA